MKHYLNIETNEVFAYELDGSQDHLIPIDFKLLTDSELLNFRQKQQEDLNNQSHESFNILSYTEKRMLKYPSIEDQLDMLFWDKINNTTTWIDSIKEIKNKYPKK